ncbi:MAG TPA: TadE family protein [Brevundimonas sp.]|nr:TadE family protein [Brevundimonas sp.]
MSARRFLNETGGASAVEFALVAPVFIASTFGIMYAALLIYSYAGLQSAAQEAARCASVRTAVCFDQTSVSDFALTRFSGPAVTPAFTYTEADCGHQVLAVGTLNVFGDSTSLSVTACHP